MSRALPLLLASFLAIGTALAVVFDPVLSNAIPGLLLAITGLDKSPFQFVPLVIGTLGLLYLLRKGLSRLGGFEEQAIFVLLAAAQLNGLSAGPLDMFDFALFGYVFLWLGTRALDINRPVRFPPVVLLGGLLIALAMFHLVVASPVRWFVGTFGITRAVLVAFVVIDLCRDKARLDVFIRAAIWLAVASAIIGIAQFLLAYFNVFVFTLIDPPESAYKPTPLGFVMRASGLAITAQHYASFLVLALPFVLLRLVSGWHIKDALVLAVIFGGILVSWNFGAFLASALVCLVFILLHWRQHIVHVAMALALAIALSYFSGLLEFAYDLSFGDKGVAKGVDQRKTLFELGIEKVMRNPFIGTGPQAFASGDGNFWGRPVHNAFGQAAAELGVFGALTLAAICLYLLVGLSLALVSHAALAPLAAASFAATLGFLMLMQSEPNLDHANTWILFGLAQSVILLAQRSDDQGRQGQ